MVTRIPLYFLVFLSLPAFAQWGGRRSFEFLHVPNNARLAALGGVNVSRADCDINFALSNPALVNDSVSGFASVGHHFYVADIGQSSATYAHRFDRLGTLALSVQHVNYGTIDSFDETGLSLGQFRAAESLLAISKGYNAAAFHFGTTLKAAFSNIAGYRASALLIDLGGTFQHPTQNLTIGLAFKNIGLLLRDYSETSDTSLPLDIQLGVTFKPEYMPLRFSLTGYNLIFTNIAYWNAAGGDDEPGVANKILQRLNVGAELLVSKNVNVLFGYNHRLRQELQLQEVSGGAGFSFGFAAHIKSFEMIVSRSGYIVGTGGYAFTLLADLEKMFYKQQ